MRINRLMRSFQIFLVNNVVDSFSTMFAYMCVGFCIVQGLIMLDREILPFYFFLVFFSLVVANRWLLKTLINLFLSHRLRACTYTSTFVKSIIKFIAQVKISTSFVNAMSDLWVHLVFLVVIIMMVITMVSVDDLVLGGSFFRTKSKSYCQNSIWVIWIASPEISITSSHISVVVQAHICCLCCAGYFIWRIFSFLADFVVGGFH